MEKVYSVTYERYERTSFCLILHGNELLFILEFYTTASGTAGANVFPQKNKTHTLRPDCKQQPPSSVPAQQTRNAGDAKTTFLN